MRESGGDVVRIGRAREIGRVAAKTIRGDALKLVANVATGALQRLMSSQQRELCEPVVIELCSAPRIDAVATAAIRWQGCRFVIQGGRAVVVIQMAAGAISGKARVNAACRALVAGFASNRRVCSKQREAVPMVLCRPSACAPTLHCVAVFALRPKLAPVNVGMAISALCTRLGKHSGDVAGVTRYIRMHAPQRKTCACVVVELRDGPNRLPPSGCVTVLARDRNRSVGIPHGSLCRCYPEAGEQAKDDPFPIHVRFESSNTNNGGPDASAR